MRQITDVKQLEVGKSYWCDNQVCRANYDKELEFVSGLLITRIATENVYGPIPYPEELTALVRDAEKWRNRPKIKVKRLEPLDGWSNQND